MNTMNTQGSPVDSSKNPCSRWLNCSAGYCPETKQGSHARLDPVCSKLPPKWIADMPKSFKHAGPTEIMQAISRVYAKTVKQGEHS